MVVGENDFTFASNPSVVGSTAYTLAVHVESAATIYYDTVTDDGLLTVTGLGLGFLAPGTIFDLIRWRVAALPGPPTVGAMHTAGRTTPLHEGLRAE